MNPKLATVLIALALPLAGCGNKGPLVLAQPPEPVQAQDTEPGEVPVEIAPDPGLNAENTIPSPTAPEPPVDDRIDAPVLDNEVPPDDDAGG